MIRFSWSSFSFCFSEYIDEFKGTFFLRDDVNKSSLVAALLHEALGTLVGDRWNRKNRADAARRCEIAVPSADAACTKQEARAVNVLS